MGSAVFAAVVAAQTVFAVPQNKAIYISQMIIEKEHLNYGRDTVFSP